MLLEELLVNKFIYFRLIKDIELFYLKHGKV